jgi:hypothetical protein
MRLQPKGPTRDLVRVVHGNPDILKSRKLRARGVVLRWMQRMRRLNGS